MKHIKSLASVSLLALLVSFQTYAETDIEEPVNQTEDLGIATPFQGDEAPDLLNPSDADKIKIQKAKAKAKAKSPYLENQDSSTPPQDDTLKEEESSIIDSDKI